MEKMYVLLKARHFPKYYWNSNIFLIFFSLGFCLWSFCKVWKLRIKRILSIHKIRIFSFQLFNARELSFYRHFNKILKIIYNFSSLKYYPFVSICKSWNMCSPNIVKIYSLTRYLREMWRTSIIINFAKSVTNILKAKNYFYDVLFNNTFP